MNEPCHLIVFLKNAELGRVKTRLAVEVGDDKALDIYQKLSAYTLNVVSNLPYDKRIYFSSQIKSEELLPDDSFKHFLQRGKDLGDRMYSALKSSFVESAQKVVIIGSDCPVISESIIAEAFDALNDTDVVIGPAEDGGYYLIGMSQPYKFLFEDIIWGTENVFIDTYTKLNDHNIKFRILERLYDVDTVDDAKKAGFL